MAVSAPLLQTAKELHAMSRVTAVLKPPNQSAVILEEEFRECSQLFITTDGWTRVKVRYVSTIVDELTDEFAAAHS